MANVDVIARGLALKNQHDMQKLVIGEFGTGFITDEMLSQEGVKGQVSDIKDDLAQHKLDYATYLARELGQEHIMRELPNGIKDEYTDNGIIKHTGYVVLDGSEDWRVTYYDDSSRAYYMIRCHIDDIMTGTIERYILTQGDYIYLFDYSLDDFKHYYVYYKPSSGQKELRIFVEKTIIDSYPGATVIDRTKNYISEFPLQFTYQLEEPIEILYPTNPTVNTQKIIELMQEVENIKNKLIEYREVVDKVTGVKYRLELEVVDGIPSINIQEVE